MNSTPWYHKYSFIVFMLIAVIGVGQAVQMMILPETGLTLLEGFGYTIPDGLFDTPIGRGFTLFLVQWIGAVLFGGDFLTAVIALTAWRKGEKWAWFAFLYWPFLFSYHFSLYRPGPHKYPPLFMLFLVIVALSTNYSRFFSADKQAEQFTLNPQS